MRCPNCGNPIEEGSLFCTICGSKVEQPVKKRKEKGVYCPYCGAYNEADSAFCEACGSDLDDLETSYDSYHTEPGMKASTVRNIIIIIIAVIALACVGGGVYWMLNSGSSNEETEEENERDRDRDSERETVEEEAVAEEVDADQEAADKVIGYIEDIGEVNLASGAAIEKAREEYDALTNEQKALVTNYSVLTMAEEAYAKLKGEEEKDSEYILPESNQRLLTTSDISGMSIKELNYARNEIYARHGRRFSSQELQSYFDSKSWYNGTISASEFDSKYSGRLSEIEKKNAEFLLAQEEARGGPYVLDR
ncbi:MAG: YARHG domain-containing protein [Ruminococcus sp.]|nr:YARHG domain-containing protein [Ruminococcus sp.]